MPAGSPSAITRARRGELLAVAPTQRLLDLADECLAETGVPLLLAGPEVGTVAMSVREPVEASRFLLGDVLVTRSLVEHRSLRGWSMRLGADRPGALAAAICDAEVEAAGPFAQQVLALCAQTEQAEHAVRAAEWRRLEPTIVRFEEMVE